MKAIFLSFSLLLFALSAQANSLLDVHNAAFTSFSLSSNVGSDPTTNVLPSFNDAYANWTQAGLIPIGGIPATRTQCGSTVNPSGLTPPQAGDDFNLITAAIAACSTNGVVQLGSGTFNIVMSEMPIALTKQITLRGTGGCTNGSTPFCASVIKISNGLIPWTGGNCTISCVNAPAVQIQPAAASNQFDFGWSSCGLLNLPANCGAAEIVADVAQGTKTVQVNSTTGFSVGMSVLIDEASAGQFVNDPYGPNEYGQVWASTDFLSTSGSPATGRVAWAKFGNGGGDMGVGQYPYNQPNISQSFWDRVTSEIHIVSSVGAGPCPGASCTVTFDDPVTIAFRQSGAGTFTGAIATTTLTTSGDPCLLTIAQIVSDTSLTIRDGTYVSSVTSCTAGVGHYALTGASQTVGSETMQYAAHQAHLYYPAHQNGTAMAFIQQVGVENLTISNAPSGSINIQYCTYCWTKNVEIVNWGGGGINLSYTLRNQIDTTLVNTCGNSTNNGAEYPLGVQDSSTETYIVNSITRQCGKGMVGKTGAAAVVAYNYMDETMYDSFSGIGDYWLDMGLNGSHYAGTHHYLFEGNWGDNCDNDNTHGNTVYHTYFRNDCTALRSAFTDPSIPASVNDATGTGHSCGTSGAGGCSANAPFVMRAAGPQWHNYWHAYVGNVMGTSGTTTTGNGWVYQGNYGNNKNIWMLGWHDDASNPTVVDSNISPGTAGVSFIFRHGDYDYVNASINDWTSGFSHTLPSSFYLAGQPSFFTGVSCTYPWPWVTPTAGSPLQTNSCSGSGLPAKARWDAGTPFVQP